MTIWNVSARLTRAAAAVTLGAAVTLASIADADAQRRKKSAGNPKFAAYVIDARTGKVLHSRYGNAPRFPASLTKMMTVYIIFEELKAGRISLSTRIRMSRTANARPPSKIYMRNGATITAEQAIYALVTKSANNVAAAVGEHFSGTESAFAQRMTLKARQLGMRSTTFRNASGLPNRYQRTTAADMAKLGLALRQHFPKRYRYFQTRSFRFGRQTYPNHNRLLGVVRGVDGIKTGYTRASGYNLVTSAGANGRRIVAVVMGGRSGRTRNAAMAALVSRWLPKASRRGSGRLIAAWRPSWSGGKTRLARTSDDARDSTKIALPTPRPFRSIDDAITVSAKANASTKSAKASVSSARRATTRRGPWAVQVGTSRSRKGANSLLAAARSRVSSVVSGYDGRITTAKRRNGRRLFRARFHGYATQKAARAACRALKRRSVACYAHKG